MSCVYPISSEDFDDYYQETCLQIWRSRDRYNQQCEWTTWVYKITLNVCMTYLKKHKSTHVLFTSDPLPEQVIDDSKESVEQELKLSIRDTAVIRNRQSAHLALSGKTIQWTNSRYLRTHCKQCGCSSCENKETTE